MVSKQQRQKQQQKCKKRKRQSRRLTERKRKKQKIKETKAIIKVEQKQFKALYVFSQQASVFCKSIHINNRNSVIASFGYFPDACAPLWKNMEEVLKKMTVLQYFNRPKRMAYHNLCVTQQPPKGIGITLGLGLKFCTQTSLAPPSLTKSINCFTEDLRKRYMFAGSLKDLDTPKKMYIKSSDFIPESMCKHAEARLHNFISTIKNTKHHHQLNAKQSTNLTYLQQQHLKFLRNNQQFIILDAYKNLGPCITERDTYIKLLLQEHLKNPNNTYSLLSEEDAFNNLQSTRLQFNAIFKNKKSPSSQLRNCSLLAQ
jgi:hypothetical protein